MPTLGAPLDFAKLEGRNFVGHLLGTAPASPVKGQLYMNSADNTLYWFDGTVWQSAKGGTGTPTGPAGGDLSGTYPNPQIAPATIVDADVAAANKDGVAATPSLRTLGAGAQQAMPGNRTLDAITAPAADVSLNNKKILALADPIAPTDGANKQYVDATAQGLDTKASVKAASISNLTLSGGQSGGPMDGYATNVGDRILVKNQTNPQENGIYIVAAGAWTRASDMDAWSEVPGAFVFVEQGTSQADTGWVCIADAGGVIGTTSMLWTQFAGAGEYIGGAGLTVTGKTFDVGQGSGITVAADTISVDTTVSRYYSSATHAAGTTWTIAQSTHGCRASRGLMVQCQVDATGAIIIPDVSVAANGDVTITFAVSQSANTIRTTVIG